MPESKIEYFIVRDKSLVFRTDDIEKYEDKWDQLNRKRDRGVYWAIAGQDVTDAEKIEVTDTVFVFQRLLIFFWWFRLEQVFKKAHQSALEEMLSLVAASHRRRSFIIIKGRMIP